MINENFIILASIIASLGCVSYIKETLQGRVQPNRVTWFLWALAPLVAFAGEIGEGVGIHSLMTFVVGFNPLLIFLASFVNKKSKWNLTRLDYVMGGLSLLGIVLWYITKNGNYAIFFAITADGLAAVPTLVKSYYFPETENFWPFAGGVLVSGVTLLAIVTWDFAHYAFPAYIFIINILFVLLIKFRLGKLLQKS